MEASFEAAIRDVLRAADKVSGDADWFINSYSISALDGYEKSLETLKASVANLKRKVKRLGNR